VMQICRPPRRCPIEVGADRRLDQFQLVAAIVAQPDSSPYGAPLMPRDPLQPR
jgi:hypothetical protein